MTTVYINEPYNYVFDGKNYTLINAYNTGWKSGDVLTGGWKGEVVIYNGLFEVVPSINPTVHGTTELPNPMEINADNYTATLVPENINKYCLLKNVTLNETSPDARSAFPGILGENSVFFYNIFNLAAHKVGTYDILCFMSVNDSNNNFICTDTSKIRFYPISFTEKNINGIEVLETDLNEPVIYYNLNGIRINNPVEGDVVIRVQSGKAYIVKF
ncbi:MAG: hypothetical protein NC102_06480 [Clostridium sp.]|nr:hypothetical protein [Clostridium sp.]